MFTPIVKIHPLTYKALSQGHLWITQDAYTKHFPKSSFLLAPKKKHQSFFLFLHDPKHPKVKARLWKKETTSKQYSQKQFQHDLSLRLKKALKKRENLSFQRENIYLAFGEADELPGLFILQLGNHILIQAYSFFWDFHQQILKKELTSLLSPTSLWFQLRGKTQKKPQLIWGKSSPNIQVQEFDISYNLDLNSRYDLGLYTDMSSLRKDLPDSFFQGKTVLNLYAYTGAFSLYALKKGASQVISVDLSQEYLKRLEKNLEANPSLSSSKHQSVPTSSEDFLKKKERFDIIISDPPSFSGDGKKRTSALKRYEKELPLILKSLNPGGEALIFLNTHQTSKKKFKEHITKILRSQKAEIISELSLGRDCPTVKGFPEGDYLKGLLIRRV